MKALLRPLAVIVAMAGLLVPMTTEAQTYPSKPVRIVNPNLPGGGVDILAGLLSQHLQKRWKQKVLLDYKPGAGTVVGTDFVAKSPPDGHTLGMVVTSHVINPSMRRDLPFDTLKDLAGVTLIAVSHIVISANPQFEVDSIEDLIALAKKHPGKLSYATAGSGSSMHLAGQLLRTMAGTDLRHVPFDGSGPAHLEVIAGRIPLMIDPLFSSLGYLRSERLKPIAVTNPTRSKVAPNVPTVAETVPGFSVQSVFGMVVPSATPRELVKRINADVVNVLRSPEVRSKLDEVGVEAIGNSPEEFDSFIRAEIDKWATVVKATGAKAD
jgi:tripartite-type tricarboxylate transporter receptor subunit TctC